MNLENRNTLQRISIPCQAINYAIAKKRQLRCTIYGQVNASKAEFFCNRNAELMLTEDDRNGPAFGLSQF
jgi:hypothetical protein